MTEQTVFCLGGFLSDRLLDLVVGGMGLKPLARSHHLLDRSFKIRMHPQPHGGIDSRAQPRSLGGVGARRGQTENIGRELKGRIALRSTSGNPYLCDRHVAAAFGSLFALVQRISHALENRAIDVGSGVDVAKANDRSFGLGAGHLEPRGPIGRALYSAPLPQKTCASKRPGAKRQARNPKRRLSSAK